MTRIAAVFVFAALLAGGGASASPRDEFSGTDLWIVNADGSHLRQLTSDSEPDFQPTVSLSTGLIAWARGRPAQIWEMRSNGAERRQLTNMPEEAFGPQWSPDGRQIAFMSWDSSNCQPNLKWCAFTNVWVMNADGSNQ